MSLGSPLARRADLRPAVAALDGLLLPAVTGLLLAASFPPASLLAAPFVALAPLAVALVRAGEDARAAARRGFVAGIMAWGILVAWIPTALEPTTSLGPAMYVAGVLLLAAFTGLFAWTANRLHYGASFPLWLAVPVAWSGAEWLRAHLGPFSFPWLELGVSLAERPAWAAPAELVGGRGLGFWMALVNGLAADVAMAPGSRRRLAVAIAVVVVLPAAWGHGRVRRLEMHALGEVAVVQPNLPRSLRATATSVDSALARLERLTERLEGRDVDLVVWPEAALPTDPTADPRLGDRLTELADRVGSPVLLGVYLTDSAGVTYNGAVLWEPGIGDTGYRYRKQRLVPGVEVVPFLAPHRRGSGGARAFGRGREVAVGQLADGSRFAPLICYESIFAPDARQGVAAGADFLVNITNDAWFGGDDGGRPTAALRQHPAHLVVRAVELRTGAVRAANSGISLFVDPVGRVHEATPVFSEEVRVATVYHAPGQSVYARVGDVVGWTSAAGALLMLLWSMPARSGATRVPGRAGAPDGHRATRF